MFCNLEKEVQKLKCEIEEIRQALWSQGLASIAYKESRNIREEVDLIANHFGFEFIKKLAELEKTLLVKKGN